MKVIYDDYHINMLMESLLNPEGKNTPMDAQLANEVSDLIGIEPLATNKITINGVDMANTNKYLLYMVMKLGERVVELESKLEEVYPQIKQ